MIEAVVILIFVGAVCAIDASLHARVPEDFRRPYYDSIWSILPGAGFFLYYQWRRGGGR